ncbi:NACHT domain-containing protein [Actinoplanes sp. NPDC051475]|uniref:NACHT domain-containing protein n=1 Tax=Actinoplanes sp. NPDC051475 TaxID=3157225 RepID=UPI00344E5A7A
MLRGLVRHLMSVALALASMISGLAFLQWLRWLPAAELDRVDKISSGLSLVVALAGLLVAIGSWAGQRACAPSWAASEQEKAVLDHLARRKSRLLGEEAARQGLHPPFLQPIRWAGQAASGDVHDLAAFYLSLSVRQMVVLGAAGSGKSAMALRLAIDLLDGSGLVPVVLPLSSWGPTQSLDAWLAAALLREHPELADDQRFGKAAVACAASRVLPILDAFDEIPPEAQVPTLRRLRAELAAGRPLVLISQDKPFRAAVEQAGSTLPRATEVEVQPLRADESASFLRAGQHGGEARWQAVIERVEGKPRGGLALLLSSPLMIYLARTAYEDPRTDPGDLIAMTVPQARAVLMGAFIPAVYGGLQNRADRPLRHYPVVKAERWLRFLARRMVARDMPGLSWWRLPELSTAAIVTLRSAVSLAALVFIGLRWGLLIGVGFAFAARNALGSLQPAPRPVRAQLRAGGIIGGAVVGGAAAIMAAAFLIPDGSLFVAVLFGLVISLATALMVNVLAGRTRDDDDFDMRASLRDDRTLLLTVLVISGLSGLRSAAQWNPGSGVQQFGRTAVFLLIGCAYAQAGVPWLRFAWTKLFLAMTRRLPLRMVAFMEDAHRRGVLRRSGATYEFRHSTFLRYLGSRPLGHVLTTDQQASSGDAPPGDSADVPGAPVPNRRAQG